MRGIGRREGGIGVEVGEGWGYWRGGLFDGALTEGGLGGVGVSEWRFCWGCEGGCLWGFRTRIRLLERGLLVLGYTYIRSWREHTQLQLSAHDNRHPFPFAIYCPSHCCCRRNYVHFPTHLDHSSQQGDSTLLSRESHDKYHCAVHEIHPPAKLNLPEAVVYTATKRRPRARRGGSSICYAYPLRCGTPAG